MLDDSVNRPVGLNITVMVILTWCRTFAPGEACLGVGDDTSERRRSGVVSILIRYQLDSTRDLSLL
jgi:hypothetical protein